MCPAAWPVNGSETAFVRRRWDSSIDTLSHLDEPVFYVASRASIPERPAMWRALREKGLVISSTWIDEAGEGETADFSELWARIEDEISMSDGLIMYVQEGDFPLKGHVGRGRHGAWDAQTGCDHPRHPGRPFLP